MTRGAILEWIRLRNDRRTKVQERRRIIRKIKEQDNVRGGVSQVGERAA